MNKKNFELLLESIREDGLIHRGLMKPSRSFEFPTPPPADIKNARRKPKAGQCETPRP